MSVSMAFLKKYEAGISNDDFESRLQRENAKEGDSDRSVSVSLAWNGPSSLYLHAKVILAEGGSAEICYKNKQAAGGCMDVDMHTCDGEVKVKKESEEGRSMMRVENIFWDAPPAGVYSISANLYKKCGMASTVPFALRLNIQDNIQPLSLDGAVEDAANKRSLEVWRFTVAKNGQVVVGKVAKNGGTPLGLQEPKAKAMKAKVMKVMKAAKTKTKEKANRTSGSKIMKSRGGKTVSAKPGNQGKGSK